MGKETDGPSGCAMPWHAMPSKIFSLLWDWDFVRAMEFCSLFYEKEILWVLAPFVLKI